MTDAPELLPCPFCGGAAKWVDIESGDCGGGSVIECCACLACSPVEFGFKENLTSRWNTRAPDPRVAALVEAAEYALRAADHLRETPHYPCDDVYMMVKETAAVKSLSDARAVLAAFAALEPPK